MSRVVLDLSPRTLLLLTAVLPLSLIVFTHLLLPAFLFILPTRLRRSNIFSAPSNGSAPGPIEEGEPERRSAKVLVLAGIAGLEAVAWGGGSGWAALHNQGALLVVGRALVGAAWLYAALEPLARPPTTVPYLLFTLYIAFTVTALLETLSFTLHLPTDLTLPLSLLALNLAACVTLLGTTLSFRLSNPTAPPTAKTGEKAALENPEGDVTLASWLAFSWVSPLIQAGARAKLGYGDVWKLSGTMQAEEVRRSARATGSARLIPRIFFNNSLDITLSLTLGLVSSSLSFVAPFFLKQILTALTPAERGGALDPTLRKSAYVYTSLALLAQILRAEVDLQQLWHERRVIVRCRSQLMGEVYEKGLRRRDLSGVIVGAEKKGGGGGSTGSIIQLMTQDTGRVTNQLMGLSSIVAAPFELAIAITFLYQILGWPCLAGLSIMAVSLPLNHILVRRRIKLHRVVLTSRDRRIEALNEFIQAIRFIKTSASEKSWLARVFRTRETELDALLRTRMNNLMINVVWNLTPDIVTLISFACFTKLAGKELTVPVAFTALALFALVRSPMAMLPSSVTQLLQTYVSIQRLEAFFEEPEVESWVSALRPDDELPHSSDRIAIVAGTFRYQDLTTKASTVVVEEPAKPANGVEDVERLPILAVEGEEVQTSEGPFELRGINVDFPIGKLSLVIGPTGSGKTSLLLALLGEIDRVSGDVFLSKANDSVDSSTGFYDGVAYTSQLPWLQHASIKNNILFGAPFEEGRYAAVLDACALRPDLEMFEAADETEIGEKGISLSGGQKARVALARAVYSRAKTVLLDDPLSAIDMHTAQHVFKKCLRGPLLDGRTVILVTHHVGLCLPAAEYVVRMFSGRVVLQGPVSELDKAELVEEVVEEEPEELEDVVEDALIPKAAAEDSLPETRTPSPAGLKAKGDGKLVQAEANAEGRVSGKVYRTYLAAAGWESWIMILVLLLAGRALRVVDRYWFKIWGESYRAAEFGFSQLFAFQRHASPTSFNMHGDVDFIALPHLPSASDNVNPYLYIYALICLGNIVVVVLGILAGYRGSFKAARSLFIRTLTRVAYAPFRYYDTTPTGRIINRFASDFGVVDMSLTDQVRTCLTQGISFIVNIGVIVVVSPRFLLPAVVIIFIYVRLSLSYVSCSRDLRRLESNARSPIYSKFGETLNGIVTCRAFGAERRFLRGLFSSLDNMLASHYASAMVNRYLLWRFDCLGAFAVAITTFLSLAGGASPGLAALAITSAQSLVSSVYWLCRYVSALEVDLNAVERVVELLETPQEPPMIIESKRPPAYWPSDQGGIVVEDLVMSYAPTLPPVLKHVSFEIKPKEKVGVVGRTGSGKSTLAMSLLRFAEPTSGRILIDGIDICTIGLEDLRSRLTLIPQEAVLFSGTIRSNLDPFEEHTDAECLDALERVQMISASTRPSRGPSRVSSSENVREESAEGSEATRVDQGRNGVSLDSLVSQGGHNYSAGQRQLLALARALLRRSTVILMDEATASVDFETDAKIQHTIREEFSESLVLTIAHRLRTVIHSDKVLVLDHGVVVEFDTPQNLLQKEGGAFRAMCEQAADWEELKKEAGL